VRRQGGQPESITIAEREVVSEDNEWVQENSFEVNAWSSDGCLLLASQVEAQGDRDETTPIVYDFNSGQHWRSQLHPLFEKFTHADCYVVFRPRGFAQDGRVLISAMSTDDDREPGTKACFGNSRWYLDFRNDTISRASPSHPRVKRP